MKVLHVYAGNFYGGIERLLATLGELHHLVPDLVPEFALCFRGRLWDQLAGAGAVLHDLGVVRLSRPWSVWRARRRFSKVLAAGNYDLAICHACWPHAIFAPVVRTAGIRLINWVHDILNGRHWLERWAALTPPDLVLANSRFTAASVATVFPHTPIEVVFLPVSNPAIPDRLSVRHRIRSKFGTSPDTVVILQASRLERWKGQSVHVEALGRLSNLPRWEAWFAGGPQKAGEHAFMDELQARVNELGIADRVRFLGQRDDVAQLMAAAEIYCQPNTGPEPFGVVLVEALFAGLPTVTSDLGGAAEIVTQQSGILVKPDDPVAVAEALARLIADAESRHELSLAGPLRARELCDPTARLTALAAALQTDRRVAA